MRAAAVHLEGTGLAGVAVNMAGADLDASVDSGASVAVAFLLVVVQFGAAEVEADVVLAHWAAVAEAAAGCSDTPGDEAGWYLEHDPFSSVQGSNLE